MTLTFNQITENLNRLNVFTHDSIAEYTENMPNKPNKKFKPYQLKLINGFVLLTTANIRQEIALKRVTRNYITLNNQNFYIYKLFDDTENSKIHIQNLQTLNIQVFYNITLNPHADIEFHYAKKAPKRKPTKQAQESKALFLEGQAKSNSNFIYNPQFLKSKNATFTIPNINNMHQFFRLPADYKLNLSYYDIYILAVLGHFITSTRLQLNNLKDLQKNERLRTLYVPYDIYSKTLNPIFMDKCLRLEYPFFDTCIFDTLSKVKIGNTSYKQITFKSDFISSFTNGCGYITLPLKFITEATKNGNLSKNGKDFLLLIIQSYMNAPEPVLNYTVRNLLKKCNITLHEGITTAVNRLNKYIGYLIKNDMVYAPMPMDKSDIDKVVTFKLKNPLKKVEEKEVIE